MFLVEFTYDYYCQGYEDDRTMVLVKAFSFDEACKKIMGSNEYENPRDFKNTTIGLSF